MSQNTLIESNLVILKQAVELLDKLSEQQYCHSDACGSPSSVGKHMRHIVEHYQSFLGRLDAGVINYNTRPRCVDSETSLEFARQAVLTVIKQLEYMDAQAPNLDQLVDVYLQTTKQGDTEPAVRSTLARELVFLHGHAVHHFAQLSSQLQLMGSSIDTSEFGKAPSTIEYEAQLATESSRLQTKSAAG
ncbi:MAG: DinB family protein [Pseudomonadales bacterium]